MRCQHRPVLEQSKLLRGIWNEHPEDDRCCRFGNVQVRRKWVCYQHEDVWVAHYRIVDRIRSIPPRATL